MDALRNDYFLLKFNIKPKTIFQSLKNGAWSDINEGDVIYSCGYPLGIKQRFISQRILSTKYIDTISVSQNNIVINKTLRESALLDLTLNKGNSGGPVINLGNTPEEDIVIGIASFLINPIGEEAQAVTNYLFKENMKSDIRIGNLSTNQLNKFYAKAVSENSLGVSGCISIDYINELIRRMHLK